MQSSTIGTDASGVYTISVTPFQENGALDLEGVDRLIDFYLSKGVTGITILGIMGEVHKLDAEEAESFTKRVVKRVGGKVPIVVGSSGSGLDNQVRFAKRVMDLGTAGLMVAPAGGLATEQHVLSYFDTLLSAMGSDIPIVFQDYPGVTGVSVSIRTLGEIIERHPQIVVIKHEEFPGLRKITAIREAEQKGRRRLSILCGGGAMHLPQELQRGADGAMTGYSFPELLVAVCRLAAEGRHDEAEDLHDAHLPILRHEYQPGPGLGVRKEILRRRGAISSSAVRQFGPKLDKADHADIDRLLARLASKLSDYVI